MAVGDFSLRKCCPKKNRIKKKGDFFNIKNYRPIAVTSVLSKIMEKAINEQVLRHIVK